MGKTLIGAALIAGGLLWSGCVEQHPGWLGAGGTSGTSGTSGTGGPTTGGTDGTVTTSGGSGSSTTSGPTAGTGPTTTSGGSTGGTDTGAGGGVCDDCPWWDEAWGYRSFLDADGSGIGADVTGVQLLVVLDPARIAYAQAAADGADLRFVTDDGTLIPHQVERWAPGESSYLWIRTDLLGSTTTRVWLYYGNAAAADAQDGAAVWSDHGGVWHLDDLTDASGNGHDGVSAGDSPAEGPLGGARSFDGLGSHVSIGQKTELHYLGDVTMSAWFRVDTVDNDNYSNVLFSMGALGEMNAANLLYGVNLNPTGEIWAYWEGAGAFDVDVQSSEVADWNDGTWHHIVAIRDTAQSRVLFYFDGASLGGPVGYSVAPSGGGDGELMIGADPAGPDTWNLAGAVDEVRLVPGVQAPERLQFQYRAESDALWTYGDPQPAP